MDRCAGIIETSTPYLKAAISREWVGLDWALMHKYKLVPWQDEFK